jgi:hypothetical protein
MVAPTEKPDALPLEEAAARLARSPLARALEQLRASGRMERLGRKVVLNCARLPVQAPGAVAIELLLAGERQARLSGARWGSRSGARAAARR